VDTDRLIEALSTDVAAAAPRQVHRALAAAALVGGLAALGGVLLALGVRADLAKAMQGPTFWMKALYAAAPAAAGFLCAERLSRPAASARSGWTLGVSVVAVLAAVGAIQLAITPGEARLEVWLGHSWRRCPFNILALAAPMLVIALVVMRRFAPVRLASAGAAAGLFAGGVAATVYGLHCGETAPAFVATWYTLGIGLCAGVGALLGPLALRWR